MAIKINKKSFTGLTFTALDFFAGSGLVTYSLKPFFNVVWANDISAQKAEVYIKNFGDSNFLLKDISEIQGDQLPEVDLSWASFPCQDLSVAGNGNGIHAERSGLVWEWLRIMDEMENPPHLLAAENVEGLISREDGFNYITLHRELVKRGYLVGAIKLNADRWLPQSRPRIFIIAVRNSTKIPKGLISDGPTWLHTEAMKKIAKRLGDWTWWNIPEPKEDRPKLSDIVDWEATVDDPDRTRKLLALVPDKHMEELKRHDRIVAPGYRRMRSGQQRLELRFDERAGCLRTPKGGSSRQVLILKDGERIHSRLITAREAARLMGAPESFWLPESYNDAYMAMGDAVAVPAVSYLTKYLLSPLAMTIRLQNNDNVESGEACEYL